MLIGGVRIFEKEAKIYRVGIIYIIPEYQSKVSGKKHWRWPKICILMR